MFRGQHHVGGAEQGVRAGGEYVQVVLAAVLPGNRCEADGGALAAADPVGLHRLDLFRPVELVEIAQQTFSVMRDAQHPLAHFLLGHRAAAALAGAVHHLLVGQAALAARTPVDGHGGLVGQAALVHLQEDPLRPAVVRRIGGVDFARPVVHGADFVELTPERPDVLVGAEAGVDALLDCVVFRRQAEGVPPHGVQHGEALQRLVAGPDVGQHVAAPMPDVQAGAGRVGKHVQAVILGPRVVVAHAVDTAFFPAPAPLALDLRGVVNLAAHRSPSVRAVAIRYNQRVTRQFAAHKSTVAV